MDSRNPKSIVVDLLLAIFVCLASVVHAQTSPDSIWTATFDQELAAYSSANPELEHWIRPDKFRSFSLDKVSLDELLDSAPMEPTGVRAQTLPPAGLLYLPTPGGAYMAFSFVESPIMAPELAAQFPQIKTYAGTSIDNSAVKVRFDYTPAGFHAQILAPGARWYIDPLYKGKTDLYASYYKTDYTPKSEPRQCLFEGDENASRSLLPNQQRSGDILRNYRLAVATTGEYSQFHGGTPAGTLAAVVTTINRVTGIYEKEVAIRLTLVANNNTIIYTNAATDPFSGNNHAGVLINESQSVIDTNIGRTNYDIGHTFSTGAGGLAGLGVVCANSSKARGVTGSSQPVGDPFDVDFVAHEIGHQFGGNHTFNGSRGNCSGANRNGSTAYEPGSGSTIQAYAGICNADDLQDHSDPIFHSESHAEIISYVGAGGACSTPTSLGNAIPAANAGGDYTIPTLTPFMLSGSGSDTDTGDTLTYLWEERDLGPQAALNAADDGQIPLFRAFTPTASPVRYLPKLATLAANTSDNAEKVPRTGRTSDWRLTVRDNNGGVDSDNMQVTVDSVSGPFQVLGPNGGETLAGTANVTWDISGTNNAPVSTANVDIFLSTDGGLTFDTAQPLASDVPNDGSQSVTLPVIASSQARIMVKGSGNIFFDISDQDFTISNACQPQALADAGTDQTICLGDSADIGTPAQPVTTYGWLPGGASTAQVTVSPLLTTTYTVTATTVCGSNLDEVIVSVDDGSVIGLDENFEGGIGDWTTSGLWHLTTDSNCAAPGYSSPLNALHYGQDTNCNYENGATNSGDLVSPKIDGIGADSILSFDYFRQVESDSGAYDQTEVAVSVVGSANWTTVWSRDSSNVSENAWVSSGDISLSAYAGESIQVRFRFDTVDSIFNTFTGWLVDDVTVTTSSTCVFPDTDGDGTPNISDTDDDNDGVGDEADADPLNPDICEDSDSDSCEDCSIGTDNFGILADNTPLNDGTDTDSDGMCNAGDDDDDDDGMPDTFENDNNLDPENPADAGLDGDIDGLSNLEEFNIDPALDPNDPDTDGDGIDDGLDNGPLFSDNNCTGGTAADAIFADVVITEITCGATTSIEVQHPGEVQSIGHLRLISPKVNFNPGFKSGRLTIISADPCASCP